MQIGEAKYQKNAKMTIKTPSKKLLSVCIILFLTIAILFGGFALLYSGVHIKQINIAKVSISGLYLRLHNKFILEVQEIDISKAMDKQNDTTEFNASTITDYVKYAIWGIAYFQHLDIKRIVLNKDYVASASYDGATYTLSFPRLKAVFDVSTKDNNMLLDIKYLTMTKPDFSVSGRIIYAPKSKKIGFGLVILPINMQNLQARQDLPQSSPNATNNPISSQSQINNEPKIFLQGVSNFKTLKFQAKTTQIKNLDFLKHLLEGEEIFPSLNEWLFKSLDFDYIELKNSRFEIVLTPKNFLKSFLQNALLQAEAQKVSYFLPASLPNAQTKQSNIESNNGQTPQLSDKKGRFPTPFVSKKLNIIMKNGQLNLIPESLNYDLISLKGTNLSFSFSEQPKLRISLASPKLSLSQKVHNLLAYFSIPLPLDNIRGDVKAQVGITIDLAKKTQKSFTKSTKQTIPNKQESTSLESMQDSANVLDSNTTDTIADTIALNNVEYQKASPPIIVEGNITAKNAVLEASNLELNTKSALVEFNINPKAGQNLISIQTQHTSYENIFDIDTNTTINLDEKKLKTSLFVHSLRVSTNPKINEEILNPSNTQKRNEFIKEINKHKTLIAKPVRYASLANIVTHTKSDINNALLLARLDSTQTTNSAESSDFVMPKPLEVPFWPNFSTPSINANSQLTEPQNSTPSSPTTNSPSINLPTPPKKEKDSTKKQNSIIEKTGDMLLPKTSNTKKSKPSANSAEQIAKLHPNDNDDGEDLVLEMPKSATQIQSPKTQQDVESTKPTQPTNITTKSTPIAQPKNTPPQDSPKNPNDSKQNKPKQNTPNKTTQNNPSSGKIITKGVTLDFSKPMSEATMRSKIIELIKAQNEHIFTYDIFRADKNTLPKIDIDIDFSNDEVAINIPSLQTYAKMLNNQIVLAVRDFKIFAPHSPLMKYLGLSAGSAILHLRSAQDIAFEVQIKDFPTFLLKKDKTAFKDFIFQGQYKNEKLHIKSAPKGLISFESYDNTMLARFSDVDIDIDALLSSKIPAIEEAFNISSEKNVIFTREQILAENEFLRQKRRYERHNNIKPHIIAIEAKNIVGFYKQITLPFDDFNAKIRDDRITADATYGNGIANIDIIHGNTLFKAGNFSSTFLNKVIGQNIVEGGLFEAGGIYKNSIFNGEISMQNTSFKGFAIAQNVIGLIDSIPSLIMFRSPGLSAKGYEVKNGKIILALNTEYIALESIDLVGKTMDVKGSGVIELESSEVDIGLSISTLKSLTSVLSKIPIVGYLILGKDGKITTQVSIDGTMQNPKSQISLAQDILNAPLDIIKRAFTPVDMLIDEVLKSVD